MHQARSFSKVQGSHCYGRVRDQVLVERYCLLCRVVEKVSPKQLVLNELKG